MSPPLIGRLLGHTQASTAQRYTHVDIDPALAAADRIGATISEALERADHHDEAHSWPNDAGVFGASVQALQQDPGSERSKLTTARSGRAMRTAASVSVSAVVLCSVAHPSAQETGSAPFLGTYDKLEGSAVTVSGLSAGGFFAHQFHVAYSEIVTGAGIVAAGPYACAEQVPWWLSGNPAASAIIAGAVCSHVGRGSLGWWSAFLPAAPDPESSTAATLDEYANGTIDDPANLADDRVWLFAGGQDEVIPPSTVQALEAYYRRMGIGAASLRFEEEPDATHGMPIEELTGESSHPPRGCGDFGLPFLIDCDFDAAGRLLRHLYAPDFGDRPAVPDRGRLVPFDQTDFFDPGDESTSMAEVGYLYVPEACENSSASSGECRLHVALHGCEQHEERIGDDFYWDAGYNRWAEANSIVVLYPQAVAWHQPSDPTGVAANPNGCWDWWGYSGIDYYRQEGKQMRAVWAMIDRMLPRLEPTRF